MQAIIFDFDGVIHDTFEMACDIFKKIHPTFCKETFRSHFEGNIFEVVNKQEHKEIQLQFKQLETQAFKELKVQQEIYEELFALSQKYTLFIISSNTLQNLNTYFENNNLTNLFQEILPAETHYSKSEKFKMLFEKYHLTKDTCIFVTDTLRDIKEANTLDIKSIACTFGYHHEHILKKGNPFKLISNFKEIRPIVESISLT